VGGVRGGVMKNSLTNTARLLRNNLTEAEKYLWYELRCSNLGFKFRRQGIIGRYIVDFVCYERKIVIEVDGGQHMADNRDIERDKWLDSQGFKILRFWNNEVFENREGVLLRIKQYL